MGSSSDPFAPKGCNDEPRTLAGIRQNPHFRPFSAKSYTIRTNLISAYDQIFIRTVAKIQSLSSHQDLNISKAELRSTIVELENMGYDVRLLTKRLELLEKEVDMGKKTMESNKKKICDLEMKVGEKIKELEEIKSEIRRFRLKKEDKQQGIDELVKLVEDLKTKNPDYDSAISQLAKAPLI